MSRKPLIESLWAISPSLIILIIGNLCFAIIAIIGLVFDPRTILASPIWAKTLKFAISVFVYGLTMFWLSSIEDWPKKLKNFLDISSVLLLVNMMLIITQAIRGHAMHYNVSNIVDGFFWCLLTTIIFTFSIINLLVVIIIAKKKFANPTIGIGIKLGLTLFLIGLDLGLLMPFPNQSQFNLLIHGTKMDFIGGHNTNAIIDGQTRMIPLLGWNMEGGDLRIPHFVGMHGLQFMIILSTLISYFGNQLSILSKKQVALVWVGFVLYIGITALVTWQALKNESIVSPSISTIAFFSIWSLVAILAAILILFSPLAKRHSTRSHA